MSWYKISNIKLQLRRLNMGLVGCNVNPGAYKGHIPPRPLPSVVPTLAAPESQEQAVTLDCVQSAGLTIHIARQSDLTVGMTRMWHINNDRTAAVSDVQSWLAIDSDTPKGVKIQLLTSGGVATYAHYHGEKFWKGWAPLPKVDKRPASPGENDGDSTKESTS